MAEREAQERIRMRDSADGVAPLEARRDKAPRAETVTSSRNRLTIAAVVAGAILAGVVAYALQPAAGDPGLSNQAKAERMATFQQAGALHLPLVTPDEVQEALNSMALQVGDRQALQHDLDAHRTQLAWLTLWDDLEEDGDVVEVSGAGFTRTVTIMHAPQRLAVPLAAGGTLQLTGIHDGGGGITVAAKTNGGDLPLPVMEPRHDLQCTGRGPVNLLALLPRWMPYLGLVGLIMMVGGWIIAHIPFLLMFGVIFAGALMLWPWVVRGRLALKLLMSLRRLVSDGMAASGPAAPGSHSSPEPMPAAPAAPRVKPAVALKEGVAAIEALHGIDEVRGGLEEFFTVRTASQLANAVRVGTLFLLVGPKGTGRATVARSLAQVLYGQGLVSEPEALIITADEARGLGPRDLYKSFRNLGTSSVGSLLVFKDADWLGEAEHAPVGRALSEVAEAHPHKLFVALVGSEALLAKLQNTPELRSAWMNVMAPRRLVFPALGPNAVSAMVDDFEQRHRVQLTQLALRKFLDFIDDHRQSGDFENAITVQALADEVYSSALARTKGQGVRDILPEDVERAIEHFRY